MLQAPLFRTIAAELATGGRRIVMDLGAPSTAMLDLLGQAQCRVEIVDFAWFGGIVELNAAEPGPALAATVESLLPARQAGDAVDLVFCWDLPNYMELEALSGLMAGIAGRARPGAIAHALIYYSGRDMPGRPGRFVPDAGGDLTDHRPAGEAIPAPRYSPEDLGRSMGGFGIDRARLLGNGMQEFLFRLG